MLVLFLQVSIDANTCLIDWVRLEILLRKTLATYVKRIALFTTFNVTLGTDFLVVLSESRLAIALAINWLFFAMSINVVAFGTSMITSGLTVETFQFGVTKFTLLSSGIFVGVAFANALSFIGADYSCINTLGACAVLLTFGAVESFATTWCALSTVLPIAWPTDTLSRRIFNPVIHTITQSAISRGLTLLTPCLHSTILALTIQIPSSFTYTNTILW